MKKAIKLIIGNRSNGLCFLLFGLFFNIFVLKASDDVSLKHREDSLLNVLSKSSDPAQRMGLYRDLVVLNRYSSQEALYARQMLEMAEQADSIKGQYEALFNLCRYYCNTYKIDTLSYWVQKLDSITTARKDIPYELFLAHNAISRLHLNQGEYELAMNEAVKQQMLVEKSGFQKGLVCSNENWGLIYMVTNRWKEAAQSFESAISILKKLKDEQLYQLQMNECLIRVYLLMKEYQKAEEALNYHNQMLMDVKMSNDVKDKTYPVNESSAIMETYRIRLYSEVNQLKKAEEAIERLTPYHTCISKDYIQPIYNLAMANYYYAIKDYQKALEYINKPVENPTDREASLYQLKVAILNAMGRKREALKAYQQFLEFGKSQNEVVCTKQINQLRSIQKLNDDEKAVQKLVFQRKELNNKHSQLIIVIIFSAILLTSLVFLLCYLVRARKLKNTLLKEQGVLRETNKNLRKAKERAEMADRMKGNFIANISHEIRTPLNAIVGFAGLLSDSSGEDRAEYMQVIKNNSDLLLNLVSDVLNLSSLESDTFTLHYQHADIQECCQHALGTVRQRVNPDVKIVFTHPDVPYMTDTDTLRLQQLLVNLLANAAKFTDQGEIHLDYKVDALQGILIFSVTDTGCGIPLDKQEIIFNRFEKVDDFKQGAGLGLSICMAISKRFGGKLYVDSSYTHGARLVFEVPLIENPEEKKPED